MAGDPNIDWAPGQPAPWLSNYGPPPLDASLAGAPGGAVPVDPIVAAQQGAVPAPAQVAPIATMTEPHAPGDPNAAPAPGEIQMPPDYVGADANPNAAQPLPGAEIEMPPDFVGQGANPNAAQVPPPALAQVNPALAGAPGVQPPPFTPPWLQQPGAPAAPQADAVSGETPAPSGESPDKALGRIATDEDAPLAQRQLAWQRMSPEQKSGLVNSADPKQLAALATSSDTPENQAIIAVRHEQARLHDENAQALDAARQRDDNAQQSYMAYQTALRRAGAETDAVAAEAQQMSQAKVDPNEHGVGHFIASVFTSALGGAMSQYSGGRNLALEELDKQTQRRIDAQKDNIANGWKGIDVKRNLIAEHLQQSGDMYRAETAYQVSTYDRAISEIQTKAQDYDPQGTTNMKAIGAVQQIQAQRQATLNTFNDKRIQNYKTAAETDLAAANADKSRAETMKIMGKLGGAGGGTTALSKAQIAASGGIVPPDNMFDAKGNISTKAYGAYAESMGHGLEAAGKQVANSAAQSKDTVSAPIAGVGFAPMKTADGNVWRPPEKFKEMLSGAARVNDHANQLARDIATLGGSSDKLNGADNQKVRADFKALILGMHEAEKIEGFRPGTADMLQEMLGGASPTSLVRDARAGILRARDNVNSDLNVEAKVGNYDGPPIQFADTSRVMAPGANVTVKDQYNERKIVAVPGKDATPAEQDQGYTNQQEQFAFAQGGALAHGSADAQDTARATLQQIAQHGGTAEYRDLAKTILEKGDPAAPKLTADERRMKQEMADEDRKQAEEKASVKARANEARATAGAVGD